MWRRGRHFVDSEPTQFAVDDVPCSKPETCFQEHTGGAEENFLTDVISEDKNSNLLFSLFSVAAAPAAVVVLVVAFDSADS
ncbi:hypothetical protein RUM44_007090 [Polyplax serrata]|uniref:Uncharacterized protein n=1 Tax=Polyplax serrata TaxID=468196 RepID=A0ABR1AZQ4_POLSC